MVEYICSFIQSREGADLFYERVKTKTIFLDVAPFCMEAV